MDSMRLSRFPAPMKAAVCAALDAGIFYQNAFEDYVIGAMGGLGVVAVLVGLYDLDQACDGFKSRLALEQDIEALIKASPRGHYAVLRWLQSPGEFRYRVAVSDGSGSQTAVGGRYDVYDALPGPDVVLRRMVGYEVYGCRRAVEAERARLASLAALDAFHFRSGMAFKNLRFGVDRYSTGVIEDINASEGMVTLRLSKRGSPNRWRATCPAAVLASQVGRKSAPCPTADLFA